MIQASERVTPRRWWALDDEELGREVFKIGTALEQSQATRRARWLTCLQEYEGKTLDGLYAGSYIRAELREDLTYNLHRRGVETVNAEICGRQKPKAQFQTSGADWGTQRRARKLDKICEAQLHQRQGARFANVWELMAQAFKDAEIGGTGAVRVYAGESRVCYERVQAHELFVDPTEAQSCEPRNLFYVFSMDVDKAIEEFCSVEDDDEGNEARRYALESAPDDDRVTYADGTPRIAKSVRIVEAWRLPLSDTKPGKHAFAVHGKLLKVEEWERDEFPFVFLRWSPESDGFWAQGLIEEGWSIVKEVNEGAARLSERVRLCSQKRTYYREGSVADEHLQANDSEVMIPVQVGNEFPQETVVPPFSEAEFQWQTYNFGKYFDLTGISQMNATARKEPGVNAAVAMRTLNDIKTVQFAPKAKMYEQAYVDLARHTIACLREIAQSKRGFKARWRGKFFLEEVRWSDAALDDDMYDVTVAPASSLPNDPAGRLEMVQELFTAGVISPTTFKNLLGWPDLEAELSSESSEYEYISELLDRYLYSLEEESFDALVDYESPEGFIIDKQRAVIQAVSKYFEAKRKRAPRFNVELIRRYIMELDELIKRAVEGANAAPAGMGSPGGPAQQPVPGGQLAA